MTIFKEQITNEVFLQDIFYAACSISLLAVVFGLAVLDSGLSRTKNLLDGWVQKLMAGAISGVAFTIIGYAVWNWQFNQAFEVPSPLKAALESWWLGGSQLTSFPQFTDPAVSFHMDVFQIFLAFFIAYAMVGGVLIASAGLERLRSGALYVMAAIVGGILMPILVYLTWGPVGPLSNKGLHDFAGVFSLYIFVGAFSLVMSWKLKPRLGAFKPDPRTAGPVPSNLAVVAAGVFVLMLGIPMAMLGCGFIFPGTAGFVGIAGTSSSMGLILVNVFVTFLVGIIGGGLISYRTKNPMWVLFGPIAAYVSGATMFDVIDPWLLAIITFFGPFFAYGGYRLIQRAGIDDSKIAPLTLGPGIYGALACGFFAWHVDTGGYPGITEGAYAFQHASITPGWQLIGVAVALGVGAASSFLLCSIFGKAGALRIDEETEVEGSDAAKWGLPAPPEPGLATASGATATASAGGVVVGAAGANPKLD